MSRRFVLPPLALAMLLSGACIPVSAAESGWYGGASQTFTHDDNLYRLSSQQAVPVGGSRSDTISTTELFGGLDQPIGRQRVFGLASVRANRYRSNDLLDNEGYALEAGVDWATVHNLSGTLSVGADQALVQFNSASELGLVPKRNLERKRKLDAVARLGAASRLSFETGLALRWLDYSAVEYDSRENDLQSIFGGVRYRPSDAVVYGLELRRTRGNYPRYRLLPDGSHQSDRLTRHDIDFIVDVQASGASRIDARIGYGRTRYQQANERDFSGLTGALRWTWLPTGKLNIVTRLARDPGQSSYLGNAGFDNVYTDVSRVTDALRVDTDYAVTAKVNLRAGLGWSQRKLVASQQAGSAIAEIRDSDTLRDLRLGVSWDPRRSMRLGCDVVHEDRSASGQLSTPYRAQTFGCYGRLTLK